MREKKFSEGDRVVITEVDDDTHVIYHGVVVYVEDEWIGVKVDGEDLVYEWPLHRVWSDN